MQKPIEATLVSLLAAFQAQTVIHAADPYIFQPGHAPGVDGA